MTGVQTCALPISDSAQLNSRPIDCTTQRSYFAHQRRSCSLGQYQYTIFNSKHQQCNNAGGSAQSSVSHPTYVGPIIKHIPRSARQHIASELSSVLSNICSNPDDVSNWSTLLEFGTVMLRAPPRAGHRHNLINSIQLKQFNSIKKLDYTPYVARLFVGVGHDGWRLDGEYSLK